MELSDVTSAILADRVIVTRHASIEAKNDRLSISEIYSATIVGEIIEEYPTDCPNPSCLILGYLDDGEPIHAVWAYDQQLEYGHLVTVYRPDPDKWIRWRLRR